MSDAARAAGLILAFVLGPGPAAAEPQVAVLDLPFRVTAMRGPASEVAVSVATSGLLPMARPRAGEAAPETGEEDRAPVVVVWGEGGGAARRHRDGPVPPTPDRAAAGGGRAPARTPPPPLPGSRRALTGGLSAYLTGPTRSGGSPAAASLTIRERQPMAVSTDPKPVPVATNTVPAGPDAVFATARPRALRLAGKPAFLVATLEGAGGGLALVGRREGGDWRVLARTPVQAGGPLRLAAVAPFSAPDAPRAATVRGDGVLQLWSLAPDALTLAGEAPGFAAGPPEADLAAVVEPDGSGLAELALPSAGGTALAVVTLKGSPRERLRAPLPAPAATGVAALGRGASTRLLVGLADGRVAVVTP